MKLNIRMVMVKYDFNNRLDFALLWLHQVFQYIGIFYRYEYSECLCLAVTTAFAYSEIVVRKHNSAQFI